MLKSTQTLQKLSRCASAYIPVQGDLKMTRNREARLQRLQDSLKQLMEEKDAKLGNDSINSRAVIERTNLLKARIEVLEQQLAAQTVRPNSCVF